VDVKGKKAGRGGVSEASIGTGAKGEWESIRRIPRAERGMGL